MKRVPLLLACAALVASCGEVVLGAHDPAASDPPDAPSTGPDPTGPATGADGAGPGPGATDAATDASAADVVDASTDAVDFDATDPTSTTVVGGVNGTTLSVVATAGAFQTDTVDGVSVPSATIAISDYAPFCVPALKANGTFLSLHVFTKKAAIVPGNYPVTIYATAPGTEQGSSDFASISAACKPAFPTVGGKSGTIVLTSVSPSELRGVFHIVFESGDVVDGTFVAPMTCLTGPSGKTCEP